VAQDAIIADTTAARSEGIEMSTARRGPRGDRAARPIASLAARRSKTWSIPYTGEVLVATNEEIDEDKGQATSNASGIDKVKNPFGATARPAAASAFSATA